jgi:hypothetical protein
VVETTRIIMKKAREKPMWIKKLVDGSGLKLDDKPKLSPPRRST